MKRPEKDVIGALFWLAVGVFFAVGGIKLNPGTLRNPGPGFLPLVMSLLLICFSLFVVAKELLRPERFLSGIRWKSQISIVASVFFYGLLLDVIGFLLSTFILMFILFGLRFSGKKRWLIVFFYAAATALAGWLVFSVALNVPFPRARLTAVWR
jgi:hypothetical protein